MVSVDPLPQSPANALAPLRWSMTEVPILHSGPPWTTAWADPVLQNTRHDLDLLVVRDPPGWAATTAGRGLPPVIQEVQKH